MYAVRERGAMYSNFHLKESWLRADTRQMQWKIFSGLLKELYLSDILRNAQVLMPNARTLYSVWFPALDFRKSPGPPDFRSGWPCLKDSPWSSQGIPWIPWPALVLALCILCTNLLEARAMHGCGSCCFSFLKTHSLRPVFL